MEFVIVGGLAVVAWLVWRAMRSEPKQEPLFMEKHSIETGTDSEIGTKRTLENVGISVELVTKGPRRPDTGLLKASGERSWLLNPKSNFQLTLTNVERATAEEFKNLLDRMFDGGPYEAERELLPLVTATNARVQEIDQYVNEHRPKYQEAIHHLQSESPDWGSASEKDREDLLIQFRARAIQQLSVKPHCDLEVLFEYEPTDATIDDELINHYGFEDLQLYLRHASKLDKVHTIPADHASRRIFEDLVKLGLAIRGQDIALESLLGKLTLKEMEELVDDLAHPGFTRKAKAIEFLKSEPSIRERLGKRIAFRELFQLLPLPSKFQHVPLDIVSKSWAYAGEVAALLARTYWSSGWETLNREAFSEGDYSWIKGWKIQNAEQCCQFCEAHAAKTYSSRSLIRIPLHIGCSCRLESIDS